MHEKLQKGRSSSKCKCKIIGSILNPSEMEQMKLISGGQSLPLPLKTEMKRYYYFLLNVRCLCSIRATSKIEKN